MKKKILVLLCIVAVVAAWVGCVQNEPETANNESYTDIDFNNYKDSEDIPDWEGEKIDVSVWMDANSPKTYVNAPNSKYDSVSKEIERITGVTFDYSSSFDNGGNSFGSKLTQVIASNEYPAMAYSLRVIYLWE